MPEFTAEFVTALSLFITTVVGAVIALRNEFRKAATKVDEVRELVNGQLGEVKTELSDAKTKIEELKKG
jgi:hypothetical protein